MFFSLLNKRIIIAIFLIIMQLIILSAFLKKAHDFHIIPFILVCIPGIIGILIIYFERNKGRF